MNRAIWSAVAIIGVAAGAYVSIGGATRLGASDSPLPKRTLKSDRGSESSSTPLSTIERAAVKYALAQKLERIKTDPASFVVEGNPHVTDADRHVRIPPNTDNEMKRLTRVLDLTELEQRKAKSLIEAFASGQALLEKYPEPARTIKRHELQRQFRLSLHTALPREKEEAADKYLEEQD
ncbi:MAG: hypothetical protein EOO73_28145 [Myxococcales bacterium]|nr:MAG: hypothetical protein EOO73_28145 [Myxococcales bacterium]